MTIRLTFVLACAIVASSQVQEPAMNEVFFALGPDKLIPLERLTATIHGGTKFGGLGGIKVSSRFKPGKSPVRLGSGDSFVVRTFAASSPTLDPNVLYVLRTLKAKGDKRELVMSESHGALGLGGVDFNLAEGVIPVSFERYGDHSLKIMTGSPLPPGEYALSRRASLYDLFCFGVDSAGK